MEFDIHAIKSKFWRRTAMLAWFLPGFVWHLVIAPIWAGIIGGCYDLGQEFGSSIESLKGLPAEWKACWG